MYLNIESKLFQYFGLKGTMQYTFSQFYQIACAQKCEKLMCQVSENLRREPEKGSVIEMPPFLEIKI